MIQAFRGGFGVTTEWQRRGALSSPVCEGARFYQGWAQAAILGPTGWTVVKKK